MATEYAGATAAGGLAAMEGSIMHQSVRDVAAHVRLMIMATGYAGATAAGDLAAMGGSIRQQSV